MGYVIAIRENNEAWYINNKSFITKENIIALFCNICKQNIDFNKINIILIKNNKKY